MSEALKIRIGHPKGETITTRSDGTSQVPNLAYDWKIVIISLWQLFAGLVSSNGSWKFAAILPNKEVLRTNRCEHLQFTIICTNGSAARYEVEVSFSPCAGVQAKELIWRQISKFLARRQATLAAQVTECQQLGEEIETMAEIFDFTGQMKAAVLAVMAALPDKAADRKAVITEALGIVAVDGQQRQEAEQLIRRLVRKSPRCYGVNRQPGWWKIVRQFLTEEEALKAYLRQFPALLTSQQRQSLEHYLVSRMAFPADQVSEALQRFGLRRKIGPPKRSDHQGFC